MMDIELWATNPAVSNRAYWEESFSGHGETIVRLTSPFQGWKPIFGQADAELERDILEGTSWLNVKEVSVNPLSRADEAQGTVRASVDKAFWNFIKKKHPEAAKMHHEVNDAVGNAFGSVIGERIPPVMLRAWLYEILVDAITCELLGEKALVASLEKIMRRWKTGQYLIGFDTKKNHPIAVVIVNDPL